MRQRRKQDPAKGPINVWIGSGNRLAGGRLRFLGSLRVDGEIHDGEVSGPTLIVGEGARVSGRVAVGRLIVYGRADVAARVRELVLIARGGRFDGSLILERPVLTVEDGGTFCGQVRMVDATETVGRKKSTA
ncbi:MAG: polymer-forming cytoskeletal protein [Acidobacteriota bacterium]|nr:MAG: polymer-forming cytoskeletal protein [Acidobacteriota bacterium]